METMRVVEAWDAALRAADWAAGRTLLTDDAT
jgi:ketosteroid isomerase-like protein